MRRWAILASLWLFAMLAGSAQTATPLVPPPPRTIAVNGVAQRMVSPDTGIVVLAVVTQGATVAAAAGENNTLATRVMQAIDRLTIPRLTLRTLGFDVQPMYEQRPPNSTAATPPRIVGYQVTNRLQAHIPDTDTARLSTNVGRVIDAALAAGANRTDQVSFTLENTTAINRELLAEATHNARDTAVVLAKAAGVTIRRLLSLSATPYVSQPPSPVMYARAEAAAPGMPIQAGELTVQAQVYAVYEIQ